MNRRRSYAPISPNFLEVLDLDLRMEPELAVQEAGVIAILVPSCRVRFTAVIVI